MCFLYSQKNKTKIPYLTMRSHGDKRAFFSILGADDLPFLNSQRSGQFLTPSTVQLSGSAGLKDAPDDYHHSIPGLHTPRPPTTTPPTPYPSCLQGASRELGRERAGQDPTIKQAVPFLVVVKYFESVMLVPYLWPDSARQKRRVTFHRVPFHFQVQSPGGGEGSSTR